jgi:hypothetical protein
MKQLYYALTVSLLAGIVGCLHAMELSMPEIQVIKAIDKNVVIWQAGLYYFESGAEATFNKNISKEYTDLLFVINVYNPTDHFISMAPVKRKFDRPVIYRVQLHGW